MSEPQKSGRGGGRGSLQKLVNELQRAPGTTQEPHETPSSSVETLQPKRFGRGAALKLLQQQMAMKAEVGGDAGRSQPKPGITEEGTREGLPQVGRGRAAMLAQAASKDSFQGFAPQLASALPQTKVQPMTFPSKDKPAPVIMMGSEGKNCALLANFIALRCSTRGVFQYHVDFEPMTDCRSMRSRMIQEHASIVGSTNAFDGFNLYLPKRLEQNPTTVKSVRSSDGVEIAITVNLVKVLEPEDCMHLYNIIFKKVMSKLSMAQIGRNYFLPAGKTLLPQHKLEVWPGYVTAVSNYEGGVMLNMDVSHRVLRTQTALELIIELLSNFRGSSREDVHKLLIGNMVLTRYNNKVYRVDDVNWNMTPMSEFKLYNGETMTFVEYYKKMYNITIQDYEQPLLVSIPKKRKDESRTLPDMICLVPELSYMTGLTDVMRNDFKVMKELAYHTRLTPMQRHASLKKFTLNVNNVPKARHELERWGFTLDTDIMEIQGRCLNSETILFGNREVSSGPEADWSRAITKAAALSAVDLTNWLLAVTNRDSQKAMEFVSMYQQCSRDMGINVGKPTLVLLDNDRMATYVNEIGSRITDSVQMIVVIFPTQREDRYNAIKKICCVERAIPSQVINVHTLSDSRKLRSVTQKIALQINCKLGGELWAVKIPTKSLMVCGVDVYHDPGRMRSSVVGFVSSLNTMCTRWFSKASKQEAGEEIVNGLKSCFVHALRKYYEVNHELPAKIVIYRDGVGDGQLRVVKDYEVEQLRECFENFSEFNYHPKLAVVVVQKRINARLLAREMDEELVNPPPGTIVDHTITRRNWYDFFLVSQHIRQGTVSPGHYVVVYDDIGWKPDIMQALSYKLTHMYYNWPGTIRVPAPCQYAHKLAYLVGQNIKEEPSSRLSEKLYFL